MLLEQKEKLETELKKFAERNPETIEEDYITKFPQFGDDYDENADEIPVYESNLAVEQNLERTLRDINAALARMDDGTYGICKYCDTPIDVRRLEARPASSSCMTCKSRILKR